MPNAIELLKADHQRIQTMLEAIIETTEQAVDTRQQLLTQISQALQTHVQIEQEIFCPALESSARYKSQQPFAIEGIEEFWFVEKLVLPDLERMALGSREFTEWLRALKELVTRHADEEEILFAAASDLLSRDELASLGETMANRKQELLCSG